MAQLSELIPPGEFVRWTSTSAIRPWKVVIATAAFSVVWVVVLPEFSWALGFAGIFGMPALVIALMALFPEAEVAVTDRHVVWLYPMDIFGKASGGRRGVVALDAVRSVDLEEGGNAMTLRGDGSAHRIEQVTGGQLETLAKVIGRPARIWRARQSTGAMRARKWRGYVGAGVLVFLVLGYSFLMNEFEELGWIVGATLGITLVVFLVLLASLAVPTLPHLLIGRQLTGEERRDFVGWMTDLRWQGVKPDGPDDKRLPRTRLQEWAMRLAYGEIPNIGDRRPEILIPGPFPPVRDGAETT